MFVKIITCNVVVHVFVINRKGHFGSMTRRYTGDVGSVIHANEEHRVSSLAAFLLNVRSADVRPLILISCHEIEANDSFRFPIL